MTPTSPQPPVNLPTAYEGMATAIAQLEKENERLRAERDAARARAGGEGE